MALRLCVLFLWLLTLPAAARAHGPLSARIDAVSRQISSNPNDASLYVERAELYRREARPDRAARDLDRAEALDPGSSQVRVCRAQLALDAGQAVEARGLLSSVLAEEPDLGPALLLRSQALAALGLASEAVVDLDRLVVSKAKPAPEWCVARANLLIELGESHWDRALDGLDQAIARLGQVPALTEIAIDLEIRRGRYDSALARIDRVLASSADRPTLSALRGDVLSRAGRPLEAWVAWSEALSQLESMPMGRRHAPAVLALESRLRASLSASGSMR